MERHNRKKLKITRDKYDSFGNFLIFMLLSI